MENCLKGYKHTAQITLPCQFGMAHVLWMKLDNKKIKSDITTLPTDKCQYGVFSSSQKDCHCMWKMLENRDEKPMTVKEIAKALYMTIPEVEETLEKALRKLRNSEEASDWFDMKMSGIDIYEGLSPYVEDMDFYNDGCLGGMSSSSIESAAEPTGDVKKRGRPKSTAIHLN